MMAAQVGGYTLFHSDAPTGQYTPSIGVASRSPRCSTAALRRGTTTFERLVLSSDQRNAQTRHRDITRLLV